MPSYVRAGIRKCARIRALSHIDMHGNHVRTSLCERTISIDFERFRDIPLVIGVAWETWRARALHACLVGGLMSALATNQGMAELLLDMD